MPYFIQLNQKRTGEDPSREIMINISHITYYRDGFVQLAGDIHLYVHETSIQISDTINALNTAPADTHPNFYKRTDPPSA